MFSHTIHYFCFSNCLNVCFVKVLEFWLVAKTLTVHQAIMIFAELLKARIPVYSGNVLAKRHQYKHVIISCGPTFCVIYVENLRIEQVVAAWIQISFSQISNGTELQEPLEYLGSIPPAAQLPLIGTFALPP